MQGAASEVARRVKALKIVEGICRTRPLSDIVTGTLRPDPLPETDEQWEAYVRRWGGIGYHPVGTCRMGADGDPLAVLDTQLRVRGIAGLRVVDASVQPEPVSANANEIGRGSCGERGGQAGEITGVAVTFKKKRRNEVIQS